MKSKCTRSAAAFHSFVRGETNPASAPSRQTAARRAVPLTPDALRRLITCEE